MIWFGRLIPIQRRLASVLETGGDEAPPEEALKLLKGWYRWGGIATLLPLISLVLMVVKPNLW